MVFDFFGTLTDPGNEQHRREVYDATAVALGVPALEFWHAVTSSFTERATGVFGSTADTLREMAVRCGVHPTPEVVTAAAAAHQAGARILHAPRAGAIAVLHTLRQRGFRIALLSDCSSELCEAWPTSPYAPLIDATVFSWAVGYRKPDPRGYRAAAQAVGLSPGDCWFVGDGGSRELRGAAAVGMKPVLVANTAYPDHAQYRDDPDAFVPADVVNDLVNLPKLIGWAGPGTGPGDAIAGTTG